MFRTNLLAALCSICTVMMPLAALAQGIDISKIPVIPEIQIPDDKMKAETKEFKEMPFGDKFLDYSIRLPANWTKAQVELPQDMDISKRLMGDAAKYYGPSLLDSRSYFIMKAATMDYDISVKNWFLNYVLSNGYVLQGITPISDTRLEAGFVMLDGDETYNVRAAVVMNGSRIILALYQVPEARWEEEKFQQAYAIKSFALTQPQPPIVEERKSYAFLDLLRFDYPQSWRLMAPNIYSILEMNSKIVNAVNDKAVNGEIDINVISTELDTTLAAEVQKVQKALEDKGFVVGDMIPDDVTITPQDQVTFSRVEVYKTNDRDRRLLDHEFWICVMMEDRYFYIVTMLTPARNADFFNWARNSRAFSIIAESLKP